MDSRKNKDFKKNTFGKTGSSGDRKQGGSAGRSAGGRSSGGGYAGKARAGSGYEGKGRFGSGSEGKGLFGSSSEGKGRSGSDYEGKVGSGSGSEGKARSGSGYGGKSRSESGYGGKGRSESGYGGKGRSGSGYEGKGKSESGYGKKESSGSGYVGKGGSESGYAGKGKSGHGYKGKDRSGSGYGGKERSESGYGEKVKGHSDSSYDRKGRDGGSFVKHNDKDSIRPGKNQKSDYDVAKERNDKSDSRKDYKRKGSAGNDRLGEGSTQKKYTGKTDSSNYNAGSSHKINNRNQDNRIGSTNKVLDENQPTRERNGGVKSAVTPERGGRSSRNKGHKDRSGKMKKGNDKASDHQRDSGKNFCPVYKQCGGCQLLDIPYTEQLEHKKLRVSELLKPFCKLDSMTGMKNPYHYRNKVHAVFDHDSKGNPIAGIYKANTHEVVAVENCLIEDKKAGEIIQTIRGMLKSFKILTYDEDTEFGLLRHVLVKRGFSTGEIMVVLVTASPVLPSKNNFVKALREKHPEITTIIQNMNDRSTSMVLGDKEKTLYGKGYIEDVLCGYTFRISSKSFYQINPVQTEVLYKKAIDAAGLTGRETVIDAYCGIGTIGIIASAKAGKIIGVELNNDAVKDAINNAKRNQITNAQFFCNDAGRFMRNMAEQGEHVDVVFMDPPRSGSTEEFMDSVAVLKPEKVVYVSCNPITLERDLWYFKKKGYQAKGGWGVDLFPLTEHVETVVLLSKLKSAQSIEVKIELDEMDLTTAESKATYAEIRQYVLDNAGFKVSQLYVAQVKRKHGLIERSNYNVGDGKSKTPQVPVEKEKAIEDALRHFKMI